MEDVKFDGKSINAYADSVWSESLTGNTRLIDESLRTKPGKYDEEELFTSLVADKQRNERYSKIIEEFRKNFDIDADYNYDYDILSNNSDNSEDYNELDDESDKVLLQRKKKRESHKKYVMRMAAAVVLCGAVTSYVVGYGLINNSEILDRFKKPKTETTIVEEKNIDVKAIAKKRFNALNLMYSNIVNQNKKSIYNGVNGSRYSYNSNGKVFVSYNTEGITRILTNAKNKGDLDFRIALLAIINEVGEKAIYDILTPCIEKAGYNLVIKDNQEDNDRVPIGPGYHSINEYLQYESSNIYYDIIVDTENKINDGSIYVFPNGTFYEVDPNANNLGRSK